MSPLITVYDSYKKPAIWLNFLTRKSLWRSSSMEKMEDYQPPIQPDIQTIDTLMSDPSQQNIQAYIEEVMRSNHYCLLNALPPIPGTKWPVTEEIWWHFYEVLPPLSYPQKNNGFAICEAKIENVHSAYYLEDGQYWHEYVVFKGFLCQTQL